MTNDEQFLDYLLDKNLSRTTAVAYKNRVRACLKYSNVAEYISTLHGRHRYFTQTAWRHYVAYCTKDEPSKNALDLFRVMKDLDAEQILSCLMTDRFPDDHPLARGGVVFRTEQGILRLTKHQFSVLSQWSGDNRLLNF